MAASKTPSTKPVQADSQKTSTEDSAALDAAHQQRWGEIWQEMADAKAARKARLAGKPAAAAK